MGKKVALNQIEPSMASTIISEIKQKIQFERITIWYGTRDDKHTYILSPVYMEGVEYEKFNQYTLPVNPCDLQYGISDSCFAFAEAFCINNVNEEVKVHKKFEEKTGYTLTRTLVAPILNQEGHALGVVQLLNKSEPFDVSDLRNLTDIIKNHVDIFTPFAVPFTSKVQRKTLSLNGCSYLETIDTFADVVIPELKLLWNRFKTLELLEDFEDSQTGRKAFFELILQERAERIQDSVAFLSSTLQSIRKYFDGLKSEKKEDEDFLVSFDEVRHFDHQTRGVISQINLEIPAMMVTAEMRLNMEIPELNNAYLWKYFYAATERLKRYYKQLKEFSTVGGHNNYTCEWFMPSAIADYCIIQKERAKRFVYEGEMFCLNVEVSVIGNSLFYSDKQKIEEAIDTLLQNAFEELAEKEMSAKELINKVVRVVLESNEENFSIKINDNGRGIPEQYRQKIWEKGKNGSFGKKLGTGIGLAAVKEIFDHLGGTIDMKTECGEGTEFIISIPNTDYIEPCS